MAEQVDPISDLVGLAPDRAIDSLLDITKYELKEIAMQDGKLVYLGELSGDGPKEHWTGSISLENRLASGEITEPEIETEALGSALNSSFVPVAIGAPKRCVDGSTIEGYDDNDPEWYGRSLGPQIQGGTTGDASGIRLAKGYEAGATLLEDVRDVADNGSSEFAPGDHTDDHASGDKTGCGQIDGHERRSEIYTDELRSKTVTDVVGFLYDKAGLNLPKDKLVTALASGKTLNEHASEYYSEAHGILEYLQTQNPNSVEKLVRPHAEVSLTLNFVTGTTFHRDHYNAQTDAKLQNFNLDVWNVIEEHGEDAVFVLTDAVATLMDLTDGSLKVFARVPNA